MQDQDSQAISTTPFEPIQIKFSSIVFTQFPALQLLGNLMGTELSYQPYSNPCKVF